MALFCFSYLKRGPFFLGKFYESDDETFCKGGEGEDLYVPSALSVPLPLALSCFLPPLPSRDCHPLR